MKNKNLLSKFIIAYLIPLPLLGIEINQESFEPEDGFTLNTSGGNYPSRVGSCWE